MRRAVIIAALPPPSNRCPLRSIFVTPSNACCWPGRTFRHARFSSSPFVAVRRLAPAAKIDYGRRRPGAGGLDFRLFSHFKRVVDLDSQVTDRRLDLGVPEQQLDRTQVLSAFVDQRGLRSSHRVRAIASRIQPKIRDPTAHDPGVLAGSDVIVAVSAARKQISLGLNGAICPTSFPLFQGSRPLVVFSQSMVVPLGSVAEVASPRSRGKSVAQVLGRILMLHKAWGPKAGPGQNARRGNGLQRPVFTSYRQSYDSES